MNFSKDYSKVECKRCSRTDLEVRSNGLCTRCDSFLYESRPKIVSVNKNKPSRNMPII